MFPKFRRFLHWLRQQFQLKPGQPAFASSFQTLISVLVPLGIGLWMGKPTASAIAILGAWSVGLVNVEGVYRQQATAKIIAAVSITAALLLANLVHGTLWLTAPTIFLVMFVAGFVNVLGQTAASISLTTSIMFVVALARFATFPTLAIVLQQCALCFAGGIWSIVVSVGIWQLSPYKPVIQSVAKCYGALSQLADSAQGRIAHLDDRRSHLTNFLQAQDQFTQALNAARDRWLAAWNVEQSANRPGNHLLILIENTPTIANSVVTLVEQVVISSDSLLFLRLQREIQQAMEQFAFVLQQMSVAISKGNSTVQLGGLDRVSEALNYQQQTLRGQLKNGTIPVQPEDYTAWTSLCKISATFRRLVEQAHTGAELITTLQSNANRTTQPASSPRIPFFKRSTPASMLEALRNNLTVHSVLFRHALRLAIIVTIAEVLASLFQIPRGYWITLTTVIALKPDYGGTAQAMIQRVLGTVFGGVIGIAIVMLIHNPWIIGGCLLLLITLAMVVRPLSASLFILLLTPAIIVLLNALSQDGWEIGIIRIIDSLAGGSLALLGSYLLFPRWQRQQLPTQAATTIRSNLAYYQQVIAIYLCPQANASTDSLPQSLTAPIPALRRQAALENSNLAAATQRLFSDPRRVQGAVEPITTLNFYVRRFFNSVTTLAEHRQELQGEHQCPDFKYFADEIVQVLENLADCLQQQQLPQPLPDLNPALEAIHDHLAQLQADRALDPLDSVSPNLQMIRERAPISTGLDQIAYEVRNIHRAIVQLRQ
ncbi:MAG TPA: FUSC family protein [Leptolyngbya sp.]|jgi:uncharacterized membrane protein YccC|nr:FUSC family protein [Leptolyngbya sp.]